MQIDVVIDVVCPWCFVGKRQLDRALEMRPGVVTSVRYLPYQLSAETPAEGVDRNEYYEKKFGNSPQFQAARQHLRTLGEALGIQFDFESECRIANTLDAHRLLRWGYGAGVQPQLADALMKAYFEDCEFLGDRELLASIAGRVGMNENLVRELLATDRDKAETQNDIMQVQRMGVSGVPLYILDQRVGLSGAQGEATIADAIDRVSAGE